MPGSILRELREDIPMEPKDSTQENTGHLKMLHELWNKWRNIKARAGWGGKTQAAIFFLKKVFYSALLKGKRVKQDQRIRLLG